MTGFSAQTLTVLGESYKIELKSLNHRFLDLKLRIPRAFYPWEAQMKAVVEKSIKRGSVEIWIERSTNGKNDGSAYVNDGAAKAAFITLNELRDRFQITEKLTLNDILSFPDVIEKNRASPESEGNDVEEVGKRLLCAIELSVQELAKMRALEGLRLQTALLEILHDLKAVQIRLENARSQIQVGARLKIKKRVEQCFEAYSAPDEKLRALMETRIAQEITYAMEKLDIEEELTRFKGHVDQVEELLNAGGPVGKKLDFMFQELNREVNTLGNKAQDLGVSQDVIELRMKIEQMREQSLNLE